MSGSPLASVYRKGNMKLARFLLDQGVDLDNGYSNGDYELWVWVILGSYISLDIHGDIVTYAKNRG